MANDMNVGFFGKTNEIFDEVLRKLAKPAEQPEVQAAPIDKNQVLKDFEDFEKAVKASPDMRRIFAALQKKFAEDPAYKATIDPNFVAGVMLLDLGEQK